MFKQGFNAQVLISAGVPIPEPYAKLGYKPIKKVKDGPYYRGWYENVKNEHVIDLTCLNPKSSRYILLQKS